MMKLLSLAGIKEKQFFRVLETGEECYLDDVSYWSSRNARVWRILSVAKWSYRLVEQQEAIEMGIELMELVPKKEKDHGKASVD